MYWSACNCGTGTSTLVLVFMYTFINNPGSGRVFSFRVRTRYSSTTPVLQYGASNRLSPLLV